MAADAAVIVAQRLEILLQGAHRVAAAALAQHAAAVAGGVGIGGGGRAAGIGDFRGFVERLNRTFAGDAVILEAVTLLEGLDRGLGLGAVVTGDVAGIQLELLEGGLNGRNFIGLVAEAIALRRSEGAYTHHEHGGNHRDPFLS